MNKKILLFGSGELGKEFVIAAQRIGQTVIAVDSYENAPAMQVAHGFEIINMLNGAELDRIVANINPILLSQKSKPFVQNVFTIMKNKESQWCLLQKQQISP